ncbi:ribosome hibernation-promoting factor, HPF/YfiA family [Amantichitinum ursilacus]|uniref:Ribosome hibernation promoting factor n=1 Tax=Amantichitinum ursilacus TaxID=857265 RepID=A0A0N0GQ26_9NEIS|nr:ribosome-associated translation inhibitor RaiA [Amantichitinum ursilacus]KPC54043.1 Ribosome hibernation promoting factor [Amantichitinum ursilacus]
MNLNISGHHLEVTPAIRDYITSKLDRITRHFDQVVDVSAILSVEKLQQKADVTVHVRGKDIHVEAVDKDMYAAIDALVDKLDRQIVKHKECLMDHRGDSIKRQQTAEEPDEV